jgi:hypothetical protein
MKTRYLPPLPAPTGSTLYQPRAGATQSAWHFGPGYESFFPTEFLDAPSVVPTGSVRGIDCDKLTLGIADIPRDRDDFRAAMAQS